MGSTSSQASEIKVGSGKGCQGVASRYYLGQTIVGRARAKCTMVHRDEYILDPIYLVCANQLVEIQDPGDILAMVEMMTSGRTTGPEVSRRLESY